MPDDFVVKGAYSRNFHVEPHVAREEAEEGASRFYQWHFDAALYDIPPPWVGCLLAVRTPKGPDCTVRWEDEAGTSMKVGPGSTACKHISICRKHYGLHVIDRPAIDVAGSRALELVPEDLRAVVEYSEIL
jgi:hypothetical protein